MAYRLDEQNGDLIIDGFEKGIASSPHEGIANIKAANISTEMDELMCSFNRTNQLISTSNSGTLTPTSNSTVSFNTTVPAGSWINIVSDSGTGLSGNYYYLGGGKISSVYDRTTSHQITNIITGALQEIFLTSGTTWTVPSDWSNVNNTIECIGAGGGGGGGTNGGGGKTGSGAGGGAYSKTSNLTLTPGGSVTYAIGAAGVGGTAADGTDGGDTYFNGASLGASSVGAKGGAKGLFSTGVGTGGQGGQSSSGVGTTKYSGGNGGNVNSASSGNGAGAGGAAGLHGSGNNGGNFGTPNGGQGDVTFGGVGGDSSSFANNSGGNGTEWTTKGSGGGGCGEVPATAGQGAGGLYGGAGGGSSNNGGPTTGGNGKQGLIRITYYSSTPITTSATYTVFTITKPIMSATEPYTDSDNTAQFRYYILDDNGVVWVHDTNTSTFSTVTYPTWFQPRAPYSIGSRLASGLAVINGWQCMVLDNAFAWTLTSTLGNPLGSIVTAGTNLFHSTLVGHQGKMYFTDGNFIASVFPSTSLLTGAANIQSYCSYTAVTTTGTISTLIGGTYPNIDNGTTRVPVFFFTDGTLPAAITANTQYYIKWTDSTAKTFEVYAAASGGSAINIASGAVGNQYFNTFNPTNSNGGASVTITPQRLNLPFSETSQSLAEIGNTVLIGCKSNTIYQWNQINPLPQDFVVLPENNIVKIITVNNMAYAFAGQKGNIYVTNGSTAYNVLSVPDYTAGVAGTPASYIEPYFTWGDAMFMRGRVWFSILDQTSTKTGQCGGVWSFVPDPANPALRIENRSSYGTYNGVCTVLLQSQNQSVIGPQYWSGWYSSITSPTYGIDFSDTITTIPFIVETDLIETGTTLQQKTFSQIEYKLASPLASGETVTMKYRQNSTDSFTALPSFNVESATSLSGYVGVNFEKGQWLQLQVIGTPLASSSSSFVRLKEIRVR